MELTEISLYYRQLPEHLEGLRILHVGDLHTRGYGPREQRLGEIMRQGCDLVLSSGDNCYQLSLSPFENKQGEAMDKLSLSWRGLILAAETEKAVAVWQKLRSELSRPLGVFMVQGNHDSNKFLEKMSEMGVQVLANDSREVKLPKGGSFNICGIRGLGRRTADIPGTLSKLKPDLFTIGLCHYPEMAEALAAGGVDLILAGHTHGGQMCLPGGRPIITHSQTGRKYLRGLERLGDSYVYTVRGVGTTFIPIRTNCPPEVARITLRRGEAKDDKF